MPISTLVKQGAFDADLENAINTNFNDCVLLDGIQSITGTKQFTGTLAVSGALAVNANATQGANTYYLQTTANNLTLAGNAGNSQNYANGVVMPAEVNVISVANANNNSAILPASQAGMQVLVVNGNSGVTISLFPHQNENINFLANNTAVTIASNNRSLLFCPVAGTWMASQQALG